jgi:UDP-N-acetylglucosamine 2-epimerase (non-hydrolysing)
VDERETLDGILCALAALAEEVPVVFPAHPRTRERLVEFGLTRHLAEVPRDGSAAMVRKGKIGLLGPLPYLDFLHLVSKAGVVLTDSGGIQEETTCLGVRCLTLRHNTERPVTVSAGTNELVGTHPDRILAAARRALADTRRCPQLPPLWDGHAAERIAQILSSRYASP